MREKGAIALLTILIALSYWNIRAVDNLSRDIMAQLEICESRFFNGDSAGAEAAISKALDRWLAAEGYTHIFIRHPEIDSCTDAFYDAAEAVAADDEAAVCAQLEKLRYHIDSIAGMERLSLGNVF